MYIEDSNTIKWVNNWADYRAIDSNGEIFEFEKKPKFESSLDLDEWIPTDSSRYCRVGVDCYTIFVNWLIYRTSKKSIKSTPWVNDWARYRAYDKCGLLYEYEYKPELKSVFWMAKYGRSKKIMNVDDASEWVYSLEVSHDTIDRFNESPADEGSGSYYGRESGLIPCGAPRYRAIAEALESGKGPDAFEWKLTDGSWSRCSAFIGIPREEYVRWAFRHLIDANGVKLEWPSPMLAKPNLGDDYFYAAASGKFGKLTWSDTDADRNCFDAGLCFATQGAAEKCAIALRAALVPEDD